MNCDLIEEFNQSFQQFGTISSILQYKNNVASDSDDQYHLHAGRVLVGEDQGVGPAGDAEVAEMEKVVATGNYISRLQLQRWWQLGYMFCTELTVKRVTMRTK